MKESSKTIIGACIFIAVIVVGLSVFGVILHNAHAMMPIPKCPNQIVESPDPFSMPPFGRMVSIAVNNLNYDDGWLLCSEVDVFYVFIKDNEIRYINRIMIRGMKLDK